MDVSVRAGWRCKTSDLLFSARLGCAAWFSSLGLGRLVNSVVEQNRRKKVRIERCFGGDTQGKERAYICPRSEERENQYN